MLGRYNADVLGSRLQLVFSRDIHTNTAANPPLSVPAFGGSEVLLAAPERCLSDALSPIPQQT